MKPRILITGATSGIGAALAARYAGRAELLLTGRRPQAQVTAQIPREAHYVEADQLSAETATQHVRAALDLLGWDTLDLAILNAGAGWSGDPAGEPAASIRETLEANLVAAIALAHGLSPLLSGGRLVLIGSTARRGAPLFASYAAAKAGLDGLARSLAEEWRGRTKVQVIHPGPVRTDIHAKAGFDPGRARRFFASPETMARLIEQALVSGRSRRTISFPRYLADALTPWHR